MRADFRFAVVLCVFLVLGLAPLALRAQEYTVQAVDAESGQALKGVPITLRYACQTAGPAVNYIVHCKFIRRKTGEDGMVHFPEAGSLNEVDSIFSASIPYAAICCDITNPHVPGSSVIRLRRRTMKEMMHLLVVGD